MATSSNRTPAVTGDDPIQQDTSGPDRPLVHLPSKASAGVDRASSTERGLPPTHPDSPIVGADGFNHPVTTEPVAPGDEVL